jgi:hypothetical protein
MEYTKGPWRVGKPFRVGERIVGNKADIAQVYGSSNNARADAKLIVKAPVLLDLLVDARKRLAGFIGRPCECDNMHEAAGVLCCLCEYAKEIGKAGGKVE